MGAFSLDLPRAAGEWRANAQKERELGIKEHKGAKRMGGDMGSGDRGVRRIRRSGESETDCGIDGGNDSGVDSGVPW